jgi:hypothetical protein
MTFIAPEVTRLYKSKMSSHTRHSKIKAMLIVFFDIQGVVMADWVPSGQTVT